MLPLPISCSCQYTNTSNCGLCLWYIYVICKLAVWTLCSYLNVNKLYHCVKAKVTRCLMCFCCNCKCNTNDWAKYSVSLMLLFFLCSLSLILCLYSALWIFCTIIAEFTYNCVCENSTLYVISMHAQHTFVFTISEESCDRAREHESEHRTEATCC